MLFQPNELPVVGTRLALMVGANKSTLTVTEPVPVLDSRSVAVAVLVVPVVFVTTLSVAGVGPLATPDREGPLAPRDDQPGQPPPVLNPEPRTLNPCVHNLHNETVAGIAATSTEPCSCVLQVRVEKNSLSACIIDCDQPSWPDDNEQSLVHRSLASV